MEQKEQLINEVEDIRKEVLNILNKIDLLKVKLNETKKTSQFKDITFDFENKDDFIYYLKHLDEKKKTQSSVKGYITALINMRNLLEDKFNIQIDNDFFYIDNLEVFDKLIETFESSTDLRELNQKRHNIISAAYHNYRNFLELKHNSL